MNLLEVIRERMAAGRPVRRSLPGGGRLHVDRPVPFLCVHRTSAERPDPGTADLVRAQASYLVAADETATQLASLVVEQLATICGGCVVVELSSAPADGRRARIRAAGVDRHATTIDALAAALREMRLPGGGIEVEVVAGPDIEPPDQAPLLAPAVAERADVLHLGLELPAVYRAGDTLLPYMLRTLLRELTPALLRAFFEFARVNTPSSPAHYHVLGRRRIVRAVREADRVLADIATSFDFLLAVSPVNVDTAWEEFCASGRRRMPALRYRMLALDPELGKRQLYDLPLDRLEDPTLAELLRDKRRELDRQLGLLEDRDTPRFLYGSLQLYGEVDAALVREAEAILAAVPPGGRARAGATATVCDAAGLAARVDAELAQYRSAYPPLATAIQIRDDVASLMISHGDVLVPRRLAVPAHRVDALLQHEIGTHVVTYVNGRAQPLRVLAEGLAGYEPLQEGLATLAEFVAGGLDGDRLRMIAARVIAVRRLVDGAGFPAVVAELTDQHGFGPRTAFGIAIRVFRGGGLTKDAIYLRGVVQLLEYLRVGGSLDALLVGKLAFEHVPLIEELLRRDVLRPPQLRPRWIDAPGAADRLARARTGMRVVELVERSPAS